MATPTVPFSIPGCRLDHVQATEADLLVSARGIARSAACPDCGRRSHRVHGSYTRSAADLPVSDHAVRLRLRVRRFRCNNAACSRKTFAESLTQLLASHARRTDRLAEAQVCVGFAAGAEPGARLLAWLRMPTSPDTVLRLLHRHPLPEPPAPRVLGVDDWAWKRGRAWGTLLVDLERRRPVDLLPDRTSEALAAWLRAHPGIEVVARDRSTEYARAITEAAPEALQVADRWHLLHNLGQVLVRYLTSARARLKGLPGTAELPGEDEAPQRRSRAERAASEATRERRHARYAEVRRLHVEEGLNALQIARALQINWKTVRKYLDAEAFPEWGRHPSRPRALSAYEGHLEARWAEGCRSALELWREIRVLGYAGSSRQVSRWAQQRRTEPHPCTPRKHRASCLEPRSTPMCGGRLPSTRRLAWILVRDPEALSSAEAVALAHVRQDAEVASLHELSRTYTQMVREKRPEDLDGWLAACAGSGIGALVTFAKGLRHGRTMRPFGRRWRSRGAVGKPRGRSTG